MPAENTGTLRWSQRQVILKLLAAPKSIVYFKRVPVLQFVASYNWERSLGQEMYEPATKVKYFFIQIFLFHLLFVPSQDIAFKTISHAVIRQENWDLR